MMTESEPGPAPTPLKTALDSLRTYDRGSARGRLMPIDQAVTIVLENPSARKGLEQQLLEALGWAGSDVAREYILSKLTLIGSDACVPAVARLVGYSRLTAPACNVLEVIPGNTAAKALRNLLGSASGLQTLAVIQSLGARRDTGSVSDLARLAKGGDRQVVAAAVAALGKIGSAKAANALLSAYASKTPSVNYGDALLTCAENLKRNGDSKEARRICQFLKNSGEPGPVRSAAERAWQALAQVG